MINTLRLCFGRVTFLRFLHECVVQDITTAGASGIHEFYCLSPARQTFIRLCYSIWNCWWFGRMHRMPSFFSCSLRLFDRRIYRQRQQWPLLTESRSFFKLQTLISRSMPVCIRDSASPHLPPSRLTPCPQRNLDRSLSSRTRNIQRWRYKRITSRPLRDSSTNISVRGHKVHGL